jgi:hypothetical protein
MNKFYVGVIAVLLLIILFMRMCSGKPQPCPEAAKLIKTDTTYITVVDSSNWTKPEPKTITYWKHDTLEVTNTVEKQIPVKIDTLAILKDYYAKRYYQDTVRTKFGYIVMKDTITENKIVARKHVDSLSLPVVTNTVQIPIKIRNQVYAGILFQGGKENFLSGAGAGLMLKTKSDKVYQIAALQNFNGGQIYQVSTFFKISFKH